MLYFSQRSRIAWALTTLSLAVLTACGGSDDPATAPAPEASAPDTSTPDTGTPLVSGSDVATVVLPARGPSLDFTQPGSFQYLVFAADGTTSTVPVAVTYGAPAGNLTLTAAAETLVATTTDGWDGVTWTPDYAGLLALDGNATLVCKTTDNTAQVGISGNVTQVTDLAELRGKTFQFRECSGGSLIANDLLTFLDDGSWQISEGGQIDSFTADNLTAYFSEAGWQIDGGIFKGRAFSFTPVGGEKQYVVVDISDDRSESGGAREKTVALFVEAATER